MIQKLPSSVKNIIDRIKSLEKYPQYLGAFIFGSYAHGDFSADSDVDVYLVVDDKYGCKNLSHPVINDKKLDLSFNKLSDLSEITFKKSDRPPMIFGSLILFDKTGKLTELKTQVENIKRELPNPDEIKFYKFMVYHADDKAKRNLKSDPNSSLLAMNINLNDLLKYHYHLNQKWWLSNKKLLPDLRLWDPGLAKLVSQFLNTADIDQKFKIWTKIVDYILGPLGGRQPISENICHCSNCRKHFKLLLTNPI